MSPGYRALCYLALAVLGTFVACDGSDDGPGGASTTTTTTTTDGSGGCGGGCIDPGQCYSSSDCEADQYCLQDNCYPVGECAPIPTDCPADPSAVCGCNGTVYDSSCAAAPGSRDRREKG